MRPPPVIHQLLTETAVTLAKAREACPAVDGKRPTLATIYSWCDRGIRVGETRVKLEHCKYGGKRVTSIEAIARFVAATSAGCTPVVERTPAARNKAADDAIQQLRGIFAKIK